MNLVARREDRIRFKKLNKHRQKSKLMGKDNSNSVSNFVFDAVSKLSRDS